MLTCCRSLHSFKQNATRVSRLIKGQRRTPLELTGDWIEFVHRHNGASHLRVQSFNMPWYWEYSIDVALFVLFIVTCTLMFLKFCCRCLCKFCRKSDGMKAKEEWEVYTIYDIHVGNRLDYCVKSHWGAQQQFSFAFWRENGAVAFLTGCCQVDYASCTSSNDSDIYIKHQPL